MRPPVVFAYLPLLMALLVLDRMKAKGIPWPRFDGAQMSNLIAFLNSGSGRRP